MSKKFRMTQSSPTRSDGTTDFIIQLYENYTVEGFIKAVLDNCEYESGFIKCFSSSDDLNDITATRNANCEYKRGKLVEKLSDEILSRPVVSATASGGYSRMDYRLLLGTGTDTQK